MFVLVCWLFACFFFCYPSVSFIFFGLFCCMFCVCFGVVRVFLHVVYLFWLCVLSCMVHWFRSFSLDCIALCFVCVVCVVRVSLYMMFLFVFYCYLSLSFLCSCLFVGCLLVCFVFAFLLLFSCLVPFIWIGLLFVLCVCILGCACVIICMLFVFVVDCVCLCFVRVFSVLFHVYIDWFLWRHGK